jgi:hypothetical protein
MTSNDGRRIASIEADLARAEAALRRVQALAFMPTGSASREESILVRAEIQAIARAALASETGEVVPGSRAHRDQLGRIVRETWVAWAREQPAPKPSWLVPWDDLAEPDREVDRRIGEAVLSAAEAEVKRLTKMLDVCASAHGHNVKLKARIDRLAAALRKVLEIDPVDGVAPHAVWIAATVDIARAALADDAKSEAIALRERIERTRQIPTKAQIDAQIAQAEALLADEMRGRERVCAFDDEYGGGVEGPPTVAAKAEEGKE